MINTVVDVKRKLFLNLSDPAQTEMQSNIISIFPVFLSFSILCLMKKNKASGSSSTKSGQVYSPFWTGECLESLENLKNVQKIHKKVQNFVLWYNLVLFELILNSFITLLRLRFGNSSLSCCCWNLNINLLIPLLSSVSQKHSVVVNTSSVSSSEQRWILRSFCCWSLRLSCWCLVWCCHCCCCCYCCIGCCFCCCCHCCCFWRFFRFSIQFLQITTWKISEEIVEYFFRFFFTFLPKFFTTSLHICRVGI